MVHILTSQTAYLPPGYLFIFKTLQMGNILYVIAVILIIGWLVGFVGYNSGGIIHVLLVIAIIAIILRVIEGRRPL